MKADQSTVTVELVKSPIGSIPKHRAVLRSLGLRKRGARRTHKLTPPVLGMINKVKHLVKVEEASNG